MGRDRALGREAVAGVAELVRGVGDGPVNEGERRVVAKLLEELPAGWKLLPNIEIRDKRGRMLEVDCVVAAPHAVYLLEVKDWQGEVSGDDNGWVHNGKSRRSPNTQINGKAKVLKDVIGSQDRGLKSFSVESFVVLARTPDRLDLAPATRVHTRLLDEIVPALLDESLVPYRSDSLPDLPDRVVRALAPLSQARRGLRQVGTWRILETLSQDDESTVHRVTNTLMSDGPAARMTIWHLSTYRMSDAARKEECRSILRDFAAARRMGPHRLVVGPIEAFEDDDDVVIVTEEQVGVPLAERLRSGRLIEPDARLSWIDDLAEAVAHAHANGVIHRRITPETVLVVSDGVRLTGFTHARIEVEGTVRHDPDSVAGRDARYLAPEVVNRNLGQASEASDLFGVAAVAWTIWSGKPLPSTWQTSDVPPPRPDDMPAPLWDVIASLLNVIPAHRTVTLEEFRGAVNAAILEPAAQPMGEPPVNLPVAPAEYAIGSRIADRYEVVDKLGAGGFAIVYRAVDTELGVERAVKVLDARVGKEAGVREVLALERVAHPNVMRVRSIDTTPTVPPQSYITSDIAPGDPLSTLGRLPLDEAVGIADQLLDACIALHAAGVGGQGKGGIVHRDIKRANVVYDRPFRHATLIDFNIASASGSTVVTMAGTPAHQPPNPDPDRWSPDPDLFGVGVLLFETLTGEHPYADGQHPASGVRSLADLLPEAPDALSRFLDQATSPRRSDRFTSAVAMRSALRAAMEVPASHAGPSDGVTIADARVPRSVTEAPTVRSGAPEVPVQAIAERPPWPHGATTHNVRLGSGRRGPRRLALAGAAVVTVVAVVVVAVLAMGGTDDPADSATSESAATPSSAPSSPTSVADSPTEDEPSGQQCPVGFPVKGNVNDAGESIYHVAEGQFYGRTNPERCFVDPAAAEAAGFRASER